MQTHSITHNETFHINSFMYTHDSSLEYVSPKDYQKKTSSFQSSNLRKVNKKVTKPKKIILGKPIDGKKQKMSLQELKALSRQIRPHSQFNSRPDILAISRNLRENLARAKSKMMDSLKHSTVPKDLEIYEYLSQKNTISSSSSSSSSSFSPSSSSSSTTTSSMPSSPNLSSSHSDDEEDDDSSVNSTNSSLQLRLVTNESGSASVLPTNIKSNITTASTFNPNQEEIFGNPLPLYTPDFYSSPSIMNMDLFFQSPHWAPKSMPCTNRDVTEDQIDSWLQRGGFGDHMSPITMATDQELADLLDFDM
ncbi:hypothetical protein BD770DRAFT_473792 [Pilaira anomala]|nr:hypothetical protein BD770DRAFT_473792 [Pilaira anomala]